MIAAARTLGLPPRRYSSYVRAPGGQIGLLVDRVHGVTLDGNVVARALSFGIRVHGQNSAVTNNLISDIADAFDANNAHSTISWRKRWFGGSLEGYLHRDPNPVECRCSLLIDQHSSPCGDSTPAALLGSLLGIGESVEKSTLPKNIGEAKTAFFESYGRPVGGEQQGFVNEMLDSLALLVSSPAYTPNRVFYLGVETLCKTFLLDTMKETAAAEECRQEAVARLPRGSRHSSNRGVWGNGAAPGRPLWGTKDTSAR